MSNVILSIKKRFYFFLIEIPNLSTIFLKDTISYIIFFIIKVYLKSKNWWNIFKRRWQQIPLLSYFGGFETKWLFSVVEMTAFQRRLVFSILKFWVEIFLKKWNEWINPQFNSSGQKIFKWDGKVNKDMVPKLFHRIRKKCLFQ